MLFLTSQSLSYADDLNQNLPEISEKLDSKIDLSLQFQDENGKLTTIREMFNGQSTLVLTLNYFRCITMCTYQFINLSDSLKKVDMPIGDGYTVASVSFDPTDNIQKASSTRQLWLKQLGVKDAAWHFYTIAKDAQAAQKLADSLNFYFEADDEGNFSHTGGLFFISADGTFKRYLYGIVYEPSDIKYAMIDASNGKVGKLRDKILIKLKKYNPARGRYEFYGS